MSNARKKGKKAAPFLATREKTVGQDTNIAPEAADPISGDNDGASIYGGQTTKSSIDWLYGEYVKARRARGLTDEDEYDSPTEMLPRSPYNSDGETPKDSKVTNDSFSTDSPHTKFRGNLTRKIFRNLYMAAAETISMVEDLQSTANKATKDASSHKPKYERLKKKHQDLEKDHNKLWRQRAILLRLLLSQSIVVQQQ